MNNEKIKDELETYIVNKLGINLCSVNQIIIDRQDDRQLKEIKIEFRPE